MATFKSYEDYITNLKKQTNDFKKATQSALKDATNLVWEETRSRYWVQQAWRPEQKSPTPLYKTWELKNSVQQEVLANYGRVYSNNWLATLHEYGAVFQMTDAQRRYLFAVVFKDSDGEHSAPNPWMITIPARPIRREIPRDETLRVKISDTVGREVKIAFE